MAEPQEALQRYGVELLPDLTGSDYGAIVGAVAHDAYCEFDADTLARLVQSDGLVADIKGLWRDLTISEGLRYWLL